jgi:hypothetical protein
MRISRHSQRTNPVQGLRLAIDCLPVATRKAMLEGVRRSERILVGAYVDGDGGVCPMLAAHRCGGRTDFLSFAKSWDRFGRSRGRARAASEREVRILVNQLEASLGESDGLDLDGAIAEHRRLQAAGRSQRPRRIRVLDPAGTIIARRLRITARV